MALPPTETVSIRRLLLEAQKRAQDTGRTQQVQIGEDLYCRIAPGGRKFLLFCLDDTPEVTTAQAIAGALGLRGPQVGWYQGETLRSLTVVEEGEALPVPPVKGMDDG